MKQPKTMRRRTLLIAAFVGSTCGILLTLQTPERSDAELTATDIPHQPAAIEQPAVNYGVPVRLTIPKINVNAAIDQMGLTPEGNMQDPSELQNAGWYKFGPRPGNKGSAVIAGHYGLNNTDTSVFHKLHTLRKGDLVHVEDEKGAIITFVVRELKTYKKDAAAPEVFSSNDGKAHLNLVTCQGAWQQAQQTYADRLVVFADSR